MIVSGVTDIADHRIPTYPGVDIRWDLEPAPKPKPPVVAKEEDEKGLGDLRGPRGIRPHTANPPPIETRDPST